TWPCTESMRVWIALFSVCTYFLVAQPVVATSARTAAVAAAQWGAFMTRPPLLVVRPVCVGAVVLADTDTSMFFYLQTSDHLTPGSGAEIAAYHHASSLTPPLPGARGGGPGEGG